MNKLILLGTGNAMVTNCYNTCFAFQGSDHYENEYFLVDAGGGNGILSQLEQAKIDCGQIHHMFVTHAHSDHVLGVVWVFRKIAAMMKKGSYQGQFTIYAHHELVDIIKVLLRVTLQPKFTALIGERIFLQEIEDGETVTILNSRITFFDILSTKMKQYGFTACLENGCKITCLGDEPYNKSCLKYVTGSNWLLCEAFCLYSQREKFEPYEKHHSTVKEACELAQKLQIENLVLYHTEDTNIESRKELYLAEGKNYYRGKLYVPNDLDVIEL